MILDTRVKFILSATLLVIAFGAGRHSATDPTTKEEETKVTEKDKSHTKTVTTTTKEKDGSVQVVTIVDTTASKKVDEIKEVKTSDKPRINIALLSGYNVLHPVGVEYGLSVSKQLLGPINVGVFGLTGGTIGVSLGMSF